MSLLRDVLISTLGSDSSRPNTAASWIDDNTWVFPSDSWRQPLSRRARSGDNKGYVTEALPKDLELKHTSSFSVHNESNRVVSSNTGEDRNTLKILQCPDVDGDNKKYRVVQEIICPDVLDTSYFDTNLLCSTSDGNVLLYKVKDRELRGSAKETKPHQTYQLRRLQKFVYSTPLPGRMLQTTRLSRIAKNTSPQHQHLFASIENSNFHVWDMESAEEPVTSKRGASDALFAAEWDPHTGNRFIVGGITRALKLFDFRITGKKAVTWKMEHAHNDSIMDIKWSPFVPHWIASAGADAAIHVWDIRFRSKPVASMYHTNAVTRIAWSPTHCDLLVSGSADRTNRLWCLSLEPHHLLASRDCPASVVGVGFSKTSGMVHYAVTRNGDFRRNVMEEAFLKPLVQSRFTDEACHSVEEKIHSRDFKSAFEGALTLAQQFQARGDVEDALQLLELCYERQHPDIECKPIETVETEQEVFQREVQEFSYFIPPNFPEKLAALGETVTLQKIEALKVNLELQNAMENHNVALLAEKSKDIIEILSNNPERIAYSLIARTVRMMHSHSLQVALEFCEQLATVWGKSKKLQSYFTSIMYIITYPTIYDRDWENSGNRGSIPEKLVSSAANTEEAVEQLSFMKKFYQMLWSPDAKEQQGVISLFQNQQPENVWSATIHRLYLNSLLHFDKYDRFYLYIEEARTRAEDGSPFYDFLSKVRSEGYPQLQSYLQNFLKKKSDKLAVFDCISQVTVILYQVPLTTSMRSSLLSLLSQLALDLDSYLASLQKRKNTEQYLDAEKLGKKLRSRIDKVIDNGKAFKDITKIVDDIHISLSHFLNED